MSAYGGKADIFPCPLFTQKRTFAIVIRMSAKGHKRTHAPQQITSLFDHLVGGYEQVLRDCEAKCFGSLTVDRQLDFRRSSEL
jgi:hypothetical protein